MSAAEQQLVGCPLPASEVDVNESIRSCVAMLVSAGIKEDRSTSALQTKLQNRRIAGLRECRIEELSIADSKGKAPDPAIADSRAPSECELATR
jgi:hypothetical protein